MSTSLHEALAMDVAFEEGVLIVHLDDGRAISVPISWFPRLVKATPEARSNWRLIGDSEGIHWPALDEDISIAALLRGR